MREAGRGNVPLTKYTAMVTRDPIPGFSNADSSRTQGRRSEYKNKEDETCRTKCEEYSDMTDVSSELKDRGQNSLFEYHVKNSTFDP